jgi:hypothetical protein
VGRLARSKRHALDDVSLQALEERAQARPYDPGQAAMPNYAAGAAGPPGDDRETPGAMLWFALCVAPAEGASIAELMSSSRMNRTTLYRHLIEHSQAGRAVQVSRGRWRAVGDEGNGAVP